MKAVLIIFAVVLCFYNVSASKILMLWAMPAHSHNTLGVTLAKALADKGHQITFVSPYPQKNPHKNIKDVIVKEPIPYVEELKKTLLDMDKKGAIQNIQAVLDMGTGITRLFLQNKDVQQIIKTKPKYDLIIMELFMNDGLVGIGAHLETPVVVVAPTDASMYSSLFGASPESTYIPSKAGQFTVGMNFWQRLQNVISTTAFDLLRELYVKPKQKKLFQEYINSEIDFDKAIYNASLMLANSHPSIGVAQLLPPNIIDVGGYHISPPKKLPEDLQKFLDDAKEGVVIFSMGSNLKSADLSPEVHDAIIKSFRKIKQKVLWKFEKDLPGLPPNVKIMSWLPQSDVLGHPNVKAFISHGGLLGTTEAIYNGVPIIGIPVFGDQKSNIASAVAAGYALSVPLSEMSEEKLSYALNEILNNPKYHEKAKLKSKLFHDRPMKPMDTALYWIEFVIRNQGAPHLRSPGVDLKWYQRAGLDIILFLATVIITIISILCIATRKVFRCLCGSKCKNVTSKSTTKKKSKRE